MSKINTFFLIKVFILAILSIILDDSSYYMELILGGNFFI